MMNEQLQNANLATDDNSDNWEHKCRVLTDRIANLQHEHKKVIIEVRTDLEFERKRANEFEEKYKSTIKYKNQQQQLKKILSQLNEALTTKENQILEYIKADQDKKRKIAELDHLNEELTKTSEEVRLQLTQIQQGAISAILEKDNIIQDLEEKLSAFESVDTHELQATIVDLEDKYKQLEEKSEAEKKEVQGIVDMKDEELRQIRDKFDVQRERYEQKINLLQQEIITFEKHIQKVNEERNHEQNIEEKYYLLEEKQRKTDKKLQEFEMAYKTEKQDLIDAIQKLQTELNSKREQVEELKVVQARVKQQEKEIKTKTKQLEETKHLFQKSKAEQSKKISQLEQEKKKAQQTYETRISELERAKVESEENIIFEIKTPEKKTEKTNQKDGSSLAIEMENMPNIKNTIRRESSEESAAIVERLKAQVKQLQSQIDVLNGKLQQQMKEVQSLRERLVATSGSASRSDGQAELLVQISDLNSYIKKVQHNLMITKLKYAEDESHWSSRQSELNKQIDKMDRKCKKEKAQLIERIDRMKKTNTKDKKTDYYQSSLK